MTAYRIPPPVRSGPAVAADLGAERGWCCGVCASYENWPEDRYTFTLPPVARPLLIGHEEQWITGRGLVPGDVGWARRFADLGGLIVCLLEITSPLVLWDVAEGKRCGLSIKAHLDPPPDDGPEWVHIAEVSLTDRPVDPLARVVSTGRLALDDWQALTGEVI